MKKVILLFSVLIFMSSCSTLTTSIKSPDNYIEFVKSDFEYTKQVSSTSSIDFFLGFPMSNTRKTGIFSKSSAIIYGFPTKLKKAENVAIYKLLKENPEYDIVLYPKFDTKFSGFILTNAEVTVTARLGKLKK